MSKGGRPKSSSGGRPSHLEKNIDSCLQHSSLLTHTVVYDTYIESIITCKLCICAINDPVEVLPCKSLIRCSCVIAHLENKRMHSLVLGVVRAMNVHLPSQEYHLWRRK